MSTNTDKLNHGPHYAEPLGAPLSDLVHRGPVPQTSFAYPTAPEPVKEEDDEAPLTPSQELANKAFRMGIRLKDPTHPTAEEIAKEAARKVTQRQDTAEETYYRLSLNEAHILTAARRIAALEAARMVRDSGAVEASKVLHAYAMAWGAEKHAEEHVIHPDEPSGESAALWRDADRMLEDAKRLHREHKAALAKLRAITQQPG